MNRRKEKGTIVKKIVIFLVTVGLLLSVVEIGTAAANRPAAQIAGFSVGRAALLDLPGICFKEDLARTNVVPEKGVETAAAYLASSREYEKSAPANIKKAILGYLPENNTETAATTFIHGEGIVQALPEKYSDEEKEMIAYVVYAEARGERFEGMVAVAQVIINRYESGKFGKSIENVVYSHHQFAVSKRYNDVCMDAVEYAAGNMPYPKNMYYFQKSKRKSWYGAYFDRIGNHTFYCGKW